MTMAKKQVCKLANSIYLDVYLPFVK